MTACGTSYRLARRPRRPRSRAEPGAGGRQGAEPVADALARPAGAARVRGHHRSVRRAASRAAPCPTTCGPTCSTAGIRLEAGHGPQVRRRRAALWSRCVPGAALSMPGMMDTILNLGCHRRASRRRWRAETGDAAFAADIHRRFREFYGRLVLGARRARRAAGHRRVRAAVPRTRRAPPPTRTSSCGPRSARCSPRGARRGPWPTATTTACRTTAAPPSPCRRWSTATSTTGPAPGCCSPATRRAATPSRTGEFLPRGQGEDVVSGEVDP